MKEEKEDTNFIAWLADIHKEDIPLVGGKGANLGEMFNLKLPVPQAFVVTVKAYNYFLQSTGLDRKINAIIESIDVDNTKELDEHSKEIHDLVVAATMPEDLRKEILEAYDNMNVSFAALKEMPNTLQALMRSAREAIFVSVRSSATAEEIGRAHV
jgi:pyruvate,water dikinase